MFVPKASAPPGSPGLAMLWKQRGFLTSNGEKIFNGSAIQNLFDATLLPATLAFVKIPGHATLNSLEAKENHLADISAKNATYKGTNGQTSVTVQRNAPQNGDLEKWTRNAQQLISEKEKRYWKSSKCWCNSRERETLVWPSNKWTLPES